ncbi:DUF535 family protein [Dyella sp.]|uniref:DUF535 family protein n=1 Tax=Dyella sp. TaxID=1869338 RepID=UPI002ED3413E
MNKPPATYALWRDALEASWRHGEGPIRRIARLQGWLLRGAKQTQWLTRVHHSRALRQASESDPRLYDRWHRPYISRHFSQATRQEIIEAHYTFVLERFPQRMRERLFRGHDIRVAMLRLENATPAYIHLRKPVHAHDGELGIYLVNEYKEVLASCSLTFGGIEGLLIGNIQGAWSYLGDTAMREFVRASCGLQPKDLLMSLIRALADSLGLEQIRAVGRDAHPPQATNPVDDAFLRAHGGIPDHAGCYDLPPVDLPMPQGRSQRRRLLEDRRESLRREACTLLTHAFAGYSKDLVRHLPTQRAEPMATHAFAARQALASA